MKKIASSGGKLVASVSSVGSRPSPQLVRRRSVTKQWNVLSTKERARWMQSRWNLDRASHLTIKTNK